MQPSPMRRAQRLWLTSAALFAVSAYAAPPHPRRATHAKPASAAHSTVPTNSSAPRSANAEPAPEDTHPLSTYPVSNVDLVAWWRGDGNATDDTSLNNGVITGGVGYAPAMSGRGFRFTGRDDAVRVADSPSLSLTRSLTFNAWVNVDEFPSSGEEKGVIFFRGDDRGGLDPYGLWVGTDQRLTFHIESSEHVEDISAPIPGRRFVMVTAMLDNFTGRMSLYENTVLVAQVITRVRPFAALDPAAHPGIGIGNCNDVPETGYRYPFHGVINDLRVYARALTPGELHRLYADCLSVPSPLPADGIGGGSR